MSPKSQQRRVLVHFNIIGFAVNLSRERARPVRIEWHADTVSAIWIRWCEQFGCVRKQERLDPAASISVAHVPAKMPGEIVLHFYSVVLRILPKKPLIGKIGHIRRSAGTVPRAGRRADGRIIR